jgi:hypothetical protein
VSEYKIKNISNKHQVTVTTLDNTVIVKATTPEMKAFILGVLASANFEVLNIMEQENDK